MAGTVSKHSVVENADTNGVPASTGLLPNGKIRAGTSDPRLRLDQFLEGQEPYSSVEVYVSHADRRGRPVDFPSFLRAVQKSLHRVTSGTRTIHCIGTWIGGRRVVIRELTTVVQTFVPLASIDQLLDQVLPELVRIAASANQECLLVVLEGRPLFLSTAGIRALAAVPPAHSAPSRNGGRS